MSHTRVAISLPDGIFEQLRQYAADAALPRSTVVARALAAYFDRCDAIAFERQMDETWSGLSEAEVEAELQPLRSAGRSLHRRLAALEQVPWEAN